LRCCFQNLRGERGVPPWVSMRRKPMTKLVPARTIDCEIVGCARQSPSHRTVNGSVYDRYSADVLYRVVADRFVAAESDPAPRFSLRYYFDPSVIFENIYVV
jgi:hypothetical protein